MFFNIVCIAINHIAMLAEIVCCASVPQPQLNIFSPAATVQFVLECEGLNCNQLYKMFTFLECFRLKFFVIGFPAKNI